MDPVLANVPFPRENLTPAESATNDRFNTMVARVLDLGQTENGDYVYSTEKTLMGHIEAAKYLLVPADFHALVQDAADMTIDVQLFGSLAGFDHYANDYAARYCGEVPYLNYGNTTHDENLHNLAIMKIILLNYSALLDAGLDDVNAYVCAQYRARWMITGAYKSLVDDETRTTVEHVIVTPDHVLYGGIVAAQTMVEIHTAAPAMFEALFRFIERYPEHGQFVVETAEHVFAAVEHVFRTKGHHFKNTSSDKPIYTAAYTKYFNAAFEGNFNWPSEIDMFHVFHTAIHPFRIKSLVIMTAHYLMYNKISAAAAMRITGAPCGSAMITTTNATLMCMKAEAWWPAFHRTFGDTIAIVDSMSNQILDNRYGYHQAAALYGVTKLNTVTVDGVSIRITTAKSRIAYISAAAQGMISALEELVRDRAIDGFALSNAKCLAKSAKNAPMLCASIRSLILSTAQIVSEQTTISGLITHALPNISDLYNTAATADANVAAGNRT